MEVMEVVLVVWVAALDQGHWRSQCHSRTVLRRRYHSMHQDLCNCHKWFHPPTWTNSISWKKAVWALEMEG